MWVCRYLRCNSMQFQLHSKSIFEFVQHEIEERERTRKFKQKFDNGNTLKENLVF